MSVTQRRLLSGLVLFLLTLACNEHGLIPVDEAIEAEKQDEFTQLETNQIDILFIIDNSGSMCQEQGALTDNFDAFIQGIAEINADFRIAVATTDMQSDNGRFQTAPGVVGAECSDAPPLNCPPSTGPVLSAADYGFDPNDPNTGLDVSELQADFRCIASVGTDGTGFEAGLDAMTTALSTDLLDTVNAGFRRSEAWLAIIFVTDENDCSAGGAQQSFVNGNECEWNRGSLTPLSAFTEFLTSYPGTSAGERVLVAGIIGPDNGVRPERPQDPRPSCSGELGDAFAGYRYEELLEAFGERSAQANICQDSFDVALDQITSVIRANLATKCLRDVPPVCESNNDCEGDAVCGFRDPDGQGLRVCSDFEIIVERPGETGEWAPLENGVQYSVNYNATNCPTGIGIEFTPGNEPGAGAEFRIRYPVQIDISGFGQSSAQ